MHMEGRVSFQKWRQSVFLCITPCRPYASSISPFFVLFPVLWVVAAVLSESVWSLDGVCADWSGSGPIMILWLVIGPNFRWVVFHSLTCLYMSLCCLNFDVHVCHNRTTNLPITDWLTTNNKQPPDDQITCRYLLIMHLLNSRHTVCRVLTDSSHSLLDTNHSHVSR